MRLVSVYWFCFTLSILFNTVIIGLSNYLESDYEEYPLRNSSPPKTLYCPTHRCSESTESKDSCCLCLGLTDWEYHNRSVGELSIRLFDNDSFHGELINEGPKENLYRVEYNSQKLMSFPKNVCAFTALVIIVFTNNWITSVENISCLMILDTLNVSGNIIRELKRDTFIHNRNLRILDLSHNMLATLDPGFLAPLTLSSFILHDNYFRVYDISNLGFMERPFCQIDISKNKLQVCTITNTHNITLETNTSYGPGFVNVQYNLLRIITDFVQKIGLKHLEDAGKLWQYGFDIRNNPIACDCNMVPYLEMFADIIPYIDRDYFNIICFDPPSLHGASLFNITKEGKWENLTCPINQKCPKGCKCYYTLSVKRKNFHSSEKLVTVDCTSAGMNDLPLDLEVPEGDQYLLYFSHNHISEIVPRRYFEKTKELWISDNTLSKIHTRAVKHMINIHKIILKGNKGLKKIPKTFQLLNPCRVEFPILHLECTCKNIWLKDWLDKDQVGSKKNKCNKDRIFCKTKDKTIPLSTFDVDVLVCGSYLDKSARNILIMCVMLIFVLILATMAMTCLYYEIKILLRERHFICKQNSTSEHFHEFDVFISCDEHRSDIRKWVMTTLIPMLQQDGYKVYLPMISLPIGAIRTEETERIIHKCRSFLVILSDDYSGEGTLWTAFEWKTVWNRFYSTPSLDIVLINFDLLERADITDRPTKALINLGYAIEFHNQNGDIHEKIKRKLRRSGCSHVKRRHKQASDDDRDILEMNECTPLLDDINDADSQFDE